MTFTATLSEAVGTEVTVDYATSDTLPGGAPGNLATAGVDYTAKSGTVSIPPGQLTGTFTIDILGDTNLEPNEAFGIALSNAVGADLPETQSYGVILNDEAPALSINNVSAAEGQDVTFTVTLSQSDAASAITSS
jgi:chitinase